jgi:dTDP-4-dehydrorhamnose reductase
MLGQALMSEASHRGIDARGASRSGPDITVDVQAPDELLAALGRTRPDVVINSAALVDISTCESQPDLAYAVNARAVAVVSEVCLRESIRLVQVSTDHYFVGDGAAVHDEQAQVRLVNEYARSKFAGEAFALRLANALVIRTNITGFRDKPDKPTFVEWAIRAIQEGEQMTLFDDFYTSTMAVSDCATALFDLLDSDATGLFNVASAEVSSKLEFVSALAHALDRPLQDPTVGSVRGLRPQRAESLGLDVSRAESVLGRELPDLETTVHSLVAMRPLAA